MKLETEFRPRDDGADIFIKSDTKDPSWGLLRWHSENQKLSGYIGGPSGEGLPIVRPVSFEGTLINPETAGVSALWTFLASTHLRGVKEGAARTLGVADQLSAWEDFLAGPGGKKEDIAPASDDDSVTLTTEQCNWMVSNRLMKPVKGAFVPLRSRNHRVGAPISGFQAITVRKAVAEVFDEIPTAVPADLAAAKRALKAVPRPSSRAVHWYASGTGETARDRAQAAASFPVLAGMIADNPILSRAVDQREPLQPLLQERCGLGKGAMKRLAKLSTGLPVGRLFESGEDARGEDALGVNRVRRFTVSGEISLDVALKHLSELPPDRMPQDDESWLLYHDILAGCAIPLENALGIPVAQTLSACKGDWKAFHGQLAKAADFNPADFDRRAIALCTSDAIEAVEDFSRTAVLPVALTSIEGTGEMVPDVSNEFFAWSARVATTITLGKSKTAAASLLEMARRYASRIPALSEATGYVEDERLGGGQMFAQYDENSFPRLMDTYTASNGLVIRNLTNFEQMRLESKRLGHCVGRMYTSKARNARCHIFSVQSVDGEQSYSTIELNAIKGGVSDQALRAGIHIVQHRAQNNGVPSQDCLDACAEWFAKIREGALWLNTEEVLAWQEAVNNQTAAQQRQVTWKGVTGMDWQDNDRRQATWEEWRYIIGGQFGKSPSPEVIFREKGARDLVGAMNPKAAAILMERAKQPAPSAEPEMEPSGP